jgi:hypothetical protein
MSRVKLLLDCYAASTNPPVVAAVGAVRRRLDQ